KKTEGNFWHGYTYSGHPTAAAVALKNLEIIKEENLIDNVNKMGKYMLDGFERIKEENSNVIDVRGIGLLGAISLDRPEGAEAKTPLIVQEALKRGLICRAVVYDGQDTLAFAPPFTITEAEMDEILDIVNESIKTVG